MTDKNYTDITVVLDRSGSMNSCMDDTIGGFNTFLKEQKEQEGKATLTLVQFDHEYLVMHDAVDINEVPDLDEETYCPRGMTALLDAVGRRVVETGERLKKLPEKERPGNVVFVVITDGCENSSKEFKLDKIKEMVTKQTEKWNWSFVYLGANQDAWDVGGLYGFSAASTMTYDVHSRRSTRKMYRSLSKACNKTRSSGVNCSFNAADRQDQADEGVNITADIGDSTE